MFKVHWGRLWEVAGAYGLGLAAKSVAVKKNMRKSRMAW